MTDIADILQTFKPISPEEMSTVKLMNRVDTKYMVYKHQLPYILQNLCAYYYVHTIQNTCIRTYNTVYYDTPHVQMYLDHHNKKPNRLKLRAREYGITGDVFCEIKRKNNKGRTRKKRIVIHKQEWLTMLQQPQTACFVQQYLPYDISTLSPQVQTGFKRITLVNYAYTERITIDIDLNFYNYTTHKQQPMEALVIIELKQNAHSPSYIKQVLSDMRVKPHKISKYCLGTMLTRSDVKTNRFKGKLNYIQKLMTSYQC